MGWRAPSSADPGAGLPSRRPRRAAVVRPRPGRRAPRPCSPRTTTMPKRRATRTVGRTASFSSSRACAPDVDPISLYDLRRRSAPEHRAGTPRHRLATADRLPDLPLVTLQRGLPVRAGCLIPTGEAVTRTERAQRVGLRAWQEIRGGTSHRTAAYYARRGCILQRDAAFLTTMQCLERDIRKVLLSLLNGNSAPPCA